MSVSQTPRFDSSSLFGGSSVGGGVISISTTGLGGGGFCFSFSRSILHWISSGDTGEGWSWFGIHSIGFGISYSLVYLS